MAWAEATEAAAVLTPDPARRRFVARPGRAARAPIVVFIALIACATF